MSEIKIQLCSVENSVVSRGLCFTVCGVAATTTRPDGSIEEAVFAEGFSEEEIMNQVLKEIKPSLLDSLKVERIADKKVTYYFKGYLPS